MGIPLGLYLSNHWGWHAPFMMIVAVSSAVGAIIVLRLQPIDGHLKSGAAASQQNPLNHLLKTLTMPRYQWTFAATMLLAVGGFMLMPFGSAFSVHNMGIPLEKLPVVYMATGIVSIITGPLMGRVSDAIGKYVTFCFGTLLGIVLVIYYCNLGVTPLAKVIVVNIILFVAITSRMIAAQALSSAVPAPQDRGAFMSINSSLQQLSGGVASSVAGLIVVQTPEGRIDRYDDLGYVVAAAMLVTVVLMYKVNRMVTGPVKATLVGAS
jgi:predicted MFS family arabinose efflux permease